ncbi:MATE family efflux transporter [bacterium]|nr:MATE family efflux transporter [candidate division CSSED10-310 bacterium]
MSDYKLHKSSNVHIPGQQTFLKELFSVASKQNALDLTEGRISRTIWIIALPQIITNSMQSLFNIVDMFWVGRLGTDAIAAVAVAGALLMVLFMAIMGVGIGASAMIARAFGGNRFDDANRVVANGIVLSIIIAIPVSILGGFFPHLLMKIMGVTGNVFDLGEAYLTTIFLNSIFIFLTFVINAALQGTGDAVTPMKIMSLALLFNTILDPILIFGWGPFPELGVVGAAWTTVFSRALASMAFIIALLKNKLRLKLEVKFLKPDWFLIHQIIKLGFPASIQLSLRSIMAIVLMRLVVNFGDAAVAAYGIGNRLFMLALFPGFGFGVAAANLVGQNLGAGKPNRSRESAYSTVMYYFFFLSLMLVAFLGFPHTLISWFCSNDTPEYPAVVALGSQMLRIVALGLPFLAVSLILNRSLGGAGDTFTPMIITLISLWGIQVPSAVFLSKTFGVSGIFWSGTLALIASAIMAFTWFHRGHWETKRIMFSKVKPLS